MAAGGDNKAKIRTVILEVNMSKMQLRVIVLPGATIDSAVDEALEKAKALDINVIFDFNGTPVFVAPYSDPVDLVQYFYKSREPKVEASIQQSRE